ncbi:hypothetical protein [Desulfovermiculus halophilus]|uniref:hypothetical protein n=1 Tax=Desulfovermiculus halophilus TaxID=339722 RepID=UPI0004852CAE|nr:hypothetical protein [Desulfovermiculus halophilus]
MDSKLQKNALQVTKEIIVKFIEVGRISPNNFEQFFAPIYQEVLRTITSSSAPASDHDSPAEP